MARRRQFPPFPGEERIRLRLLGCGTSFGVPRLGGDWGECDPTEPRNRRRRASIAIFHAGTAILVDTSPDLREQLLDTGLVDLDAVLWTHDHADHCHGIDDLRGLFALRGAPVPAFAEAGTLASLRRRFAYCFEGGGGYPAMLEGQSLPDDGEIGSIRVRSVEQPHGHTTSTGFRFDADGRSIAYTTDCNVLTEPMTTLFAGVDLWVVDTLRRRPHPSHVHLDLALDWIARVRPGRAILTHMDSSLDYRTLVAELPAGVEPGYDGLEVEL